MSWYKKLLIDEIIEQFKENLYNDLKIEYTQFKKSYDSNTVNIEHNNLIDWYDEEKNQQELLRLIRNLWALLNITANRAMPAHDARHAIYKVPVFALKYIEAQSVYNYEKLSLIGALAHDFGRWSEERIFGNAAGGAIHSRMSYVLLKDFLEHYDLPLVLKNELLNCVIEHTTGANETDNMMLKIVVGSDRDQLVGPEFVLRLMHHKPTDKSLKSFFGELGDEGILEKIYYMYFNRLPGPLYSVMDYKQLFRIIYIFNAIVFKDDWQDIIKANLHKKHNIIDLNLDKNYCDNYLKNYIFENNMEIDDLNDIIIELLNSKNLAPNQLYKDLALNKANHTKDVMNRKNLANGLKWINKERKRLDIEQYEDLVRIEKQQEEQWILWLIEQLKKNWF